MKKHLLKLWILLLFVAALFALPMTAQAETSGTCGDNLTWVLDDEGTLTISGTGEMADYSYFDNTSPWGKQVKNVEIEDGVTSIGEFAFFRCQSLTSVSIPDSVTRIGEEAFGDCIKLTSVAIPSDVTSIGNNAFYGCHRLPHITIPESVTSIGRGAFAECGALTSITIPKGVTTISDLTFFWCNDLTSITLPDGITNIGAEAFALCSSLTSITLPDSVTSIGGGAFKDCSSLTSVKLPKDVTTINDYTFFGCSNLSSITLPAGLTSISDSAFSDCTSLHRVFVDGDERPSYTLPAPLSEATVYCTEFSEVDFWAILNGYKTAYIDMDESGIGAVITLPESLVLWAGDNTNITADVFPPIDETLLVWKSSDESVATVKDGVVTARAPGKAKISLSCGSISGSTTLTVYAIPESFTIPEELWIVSKDKRILELDELKPIGALGEYTWTSSDPEVFVVKGYNYAEITALRPGDAVLTVKEEKSGITRTCTVHVVYPVDTITFAESELQMKPGETKQLTATVTTRDQTLTNKLVTFSSSNPLVATVDEDGVVKAVAEGSATITATAGNGVSASCTVTVQPLLKSFTLSAHEVWVFSQTTEEITISDIQPIGAVCHFVVSSSNADAATGVLSDNCITVQGVQPGDAVLTIADETSGLSQSCTVHVLHPVTTIAFAESDAALIPGDTKQLTATVTCQDQSFTNRFVTFSSSDEKVATVDQNGVVTALTEGTVTITATASNGVSASCTIKVQLLGDANGDGKVDAADALVVLQYSAGWDVTVNTAKADVTGDGMIGISDALKILQDCMGGDIAKAMRALQRMLADLNGSSLVIIEQPADQCVMAGETATFIVTATGDALKYQWYIDRNDGTGWQKLNNAVDAIYVTSKTEADNDGYQYRCVITDAHGAEVTSDAVVLHVVLELPNTGDASMPALWLAMCMLSVTGLVILKRRSAIR